MKNLLVALLMCSAGFAGATASQQPSFTPPNSNPNYMPNLAFYGANVYRLESSTAANAAVSLFTGSGYLYGISCSSGASGDFGLAYDSGSVTGINVTTTGISLSPAVLSSSNSVTSCTAGGVCGQWSAPGGAVRVHNGLVALKYGAAASGLFETCYLYALPDAVIQAAPQTH